MSSELKKELLFFERKPKFIEKHAGFVKFLSFFIAVASITVATSPLIKRMELPSAESNLGKVATATIRADRDYVVIDHEATRHAREAAVKNVKPIFFFDASLADSISDSVKEAFNYIRNNIQIAIYQGVDGDSSEVALYKKAREGISKRELEIIREVANSSREEFEKGLGVKLSDEEFSKLTSFLFSREIEDGIISIIQPIMQEMIVEEKQKLIQEMGSGIMIQRIYAKEQRAEGIVSSLTSIKDITEIRKLLEKKIIFLLADYNKDERKLIISIATKLIRPNLFFNHSETERRKEEAINQVVPVTINVKKGDILIRDGEKITQEHIKLFKGIHQQATKIKDVITTIGMFLFSSIIILVPYIFARTYIRKFAPKTKDILLMGILASFTIIFGKLLLTVCVALSDYFPNIPQYIWEYMVPFAAGAMLVRFILNSETAIIFSVVISGFSYLLTSNDMYYGFYTLIGSMIAAYSVAQATTRAVILKGGVITGIVNAIMIIIFSLMRGEQINSTVLLGCMLGFINGIMVSMIVTSSAPVLEMAMDYITDIKLLELANLNHPLLKELIVKAPGTYHHSIVVASLVETAAEDIGANPLLAKVCAYYHDIGKISKPDYFGENQKDGINKHDNIKPTMSALILKSHVKDGIDMARNYKLGSPIIDVIEQHHGTSLIKYFYQKAKKLGDSVNEEDFRYPGPKPQTRESALVMLADSVEAAAKSVPDLDATRLRGLVQKIINNIFKDGQLSECDLTLRDLDKIARAFIKVLDGIYHQRPEYFEPAIKQSESQRKSNDERMNGEQDKEDDSEDNDVDLKRLGL
ncbi:MAG: HDIG domain-containing protein [Deltaproteobacteria bacterium]|nr:HDIG domain-containing protein [Deltaproteobacteria bacterium]